MEGQYPHHQGDRDPPVEVRVVVFSLQEKKLQALFVPENYTDPATHWVIPGAPVIGCPSLERVASDCLSTYTAQHEAYLEQLYTYSSPERGTISVVYFALVPQTATTSTRQRRLERAKWLPIEAPLSLISNHAEILQYALRRLRYKLEYTAVGFELLPENFSLSELQATYEIILGEKLDKRNFRRRILKADIIEPTSDLRTGEGRPARLFRYRPDAVAEVKTRRLFP